MIITLPIFFPILAGLAMSKLQISDRKARERYVFITLLSTLVFTLIAGFADNGGEFKKVDQLELTETYEYRTHLYYCDPMASWQKPHIEKNHEYIRYAIPKKRSLNPYTQEDMTLLMNHINSTKRPGLGNKSPYELLLEDENNEDFMLLWQLLKMDLIPPDEVHLMPDLFKFNL